MPRVELENDRITIHSEWRERESIQQVPGTRWDEKERTWYCSLSWASCAALRGVFETDLEIGPELNAWAAADVANRVGPCMALREAEDLDPTNPIALKLAEIGIGQLLEPRQRVGVAFLATARRALLADGMGSGKTVQVIAALEALGDDAYPAIIVCPKSMLFTWEREFGIWAPKRSAAVVTGGAVARKKTIERLKPCLVHGVPQAWEGTTSRLDSAAVVMNLTLENETQTSTLDRIEVHDDGAKQNMVVEWPAEVVGKGTFAQNSESQSKSMHGCFIVKDSAAFSAIVTSMTSKMLSLSIIATRPDGSVVFSACDATTLSSEANPIQNGSTEHQCTCESRIEVAAINWEGLKAHTRVAGYGYIKLKDAEKEPKEFNEIGVRTVIADEAHRAKNPKAVQTRAWWHLSWSAEYSFAMTGTPVNNTPEDLWSIMHGVEPSEWPSKTAWIERYGLTTYNYFGGMSVIGVKAETKDELFKYLDPRFIRRPTQVVIPNIAAKLEPQIREIELSPKQRKAYDSMRKEMLAELDGGVLMATDPLTRLTRLSQLSAAYGELIEDVTAPDGFRLQLAEPSAVLDAFDDVLDEFGDEPVVAFAESRQLIDLAAKRLDKKKIDFSTITGGVEPRAREIAVERFQAGDLRVLLLTLGAGAEGITLTATRLPVFLQRSFSLTKNLQAVDRTWRRGQEKDVQPIYIEPRDTIAARVRQVGLQKEARLEEIVRDGDTLRKLLT